MYSLTLDLYWHKKELIACLLVYVEDINNPYLQVIKEESHQLNNKYHFLGQTQLKQSIIEGRKVATGIGPHHPISLDQDAD